MKENEIKKLISQYKKTIEKEWSTLYGEDLTINLEDAFLTLLDKKENSESKIEIATAIEKTNSFVLLGEAGSGKSTLLQFIGLCFVYKNWARTKLKINKEFIPIMIRLREFESILAQPGPKIELAIALSIREQIRNLSEEKAIALTWSLLKQNKLIILLDGFDEVQENFREKINAEIRRFAISNYGKSNKLVISSRPHGSYNFPEFKEYTIPPIDEEEKIRNFVQLWIKALKPEWDKEKLLLNINDLIDQLRHNLSLRNFINTPLILRLAAQHFVNHNFVPENRTRLYSKYLKDVWERAVKRGVNPNLESIVFEGLEELAWDTQLNKEPQISSEVIKIVIEKMGVVRKNFNKYVFSHTTIQEYFIGKKLATAWKSNSNSTWKYLSPRIHNSKWREPILLMSGELTEKESFDLQKKIYSRSLFKDKHIDDILFIFSLLREGCSVFPKIREKIFNEITRVYFLWETPYFNVLKWKYNWVLGSVGVFGNFSLPILRRILSKQQSPEVLNSEEIQSQIIAALTEINTEESIQILIDIYNHQAITYVNAIESIVALGSLKVKKMIPDMLAMVNTGDTTWGNGGAHALLAFKSDEVIPLIFDLFKETDRWNDYHGDKVWIITNLLTEIGAASIPSAKQGLKNKSVLAKIVSIKVLEKFNRTEVIPDLMLMLEKENDIVKEFAILALVTFNAKKAIPKILKILKSKGDISLRSVAASSLGYLKARNSLTDLYKTYLEDESEQVRESAMLGLRLIGEKTYLQKITSKQEIPIIFQSIKEEVSKSNYLHSYYTNKAIDKLRDQKQESVKFLIKELENAGDPQSQITAIKLLVEINQGNITNRLCKLMNSDNDKVKTEVINALFRYKSPESVACLIGLLNTDNKNLKALIIDRLGELNAQEAIPQIKSTLNDKDLQMISAIALGKMFVLESLPYLRKTQRKIPNLFVIRTLNKLSNIFNNTLGRLIKIGISFRFKEDDKDYGGGQNSPHFIIRGLINNTYKFQDEDEKRFFIKELRELKKAGIHNYEVESKLEEFKNNNGVEEDLFENSKPLWGQILNISVNLIITILALSLLSFLIIISNIFNSYFEEILRQPIQSWIVLNYDRAIILILVLGVITNLLYWLVQIFSDRIKK